jgi:hypothetical protein
MAQCQVAFAAEVIQVVHHARDTNADNLLTGDESWVYYEYLHDSGSINKSSSDSSVKEN